MFIGQNPYSDVNNSLMKENWVINDRVRVSTRAADRWMAILVAILFIVHQKISTVNLVKEFDESNPCIRFWKK